MSLADIRIGMAANLRTAYPDGVQVNKYVILSPSPPTLMIRKGGTQYDLAMNRGLDDVTMIVQGLVGVTETGQIQLDAWMDSDAGGVKHAIELDRSLGGSVEDSLVRLVSEPNIATIGGIEYLLAEWSVSVYPKGA